MKIVFFAGPLSAYYSRSSSDDRASLVEPILGWMRFITPQFRSAGVMIVDWNENPDAPTRELMADADGYWSLRLLSAYDQCPGMQRPDVAPESPASDPAMIAIRDAFAKTRTPHLHACDVWLPLRAAEPVEVQTPTEAIKPVGSVVMLKAETIQIAARVVGCDGVDALRTAASDRNRSSLERAGAGFAAELLEICEFALMNRLPLAAGFDGVHGVV